MLARAHTHTQHTMLVVANLRLLSGPAHNINHCALTVFIASAVSSVTSPRYCSAHRAARRSIIVTYEYACNRLFICECVYVCVCVEDMQTSMLVIIRNVGPF